MKDEISALMDGELDPEAAGSVISQLKKVDELRGEWAVYHLISDALGRPEAMPADVTRRVRARLAEEPTVLAPRPPARHQTKVLAAAASVAAVAVIGWMSLQTTERLADNMADNKSIITTPNTAALQTIPAAVPVPASMPAPAQINDYLLAHRQFSPSTAMHGTTPYLHTVVESRENAPR